MNDHLKYLTELLDKEIATFRFLMASLVAEQEALVQNDTVGLSEAVETQKALTRRAGLQERDRVKIVRQLATLLQEDANRLTLKRVIDLVDKPFADRLRTQRETLLTLQDDLRKTNRQNSLLIKQTMKYVDKTLQILSGSVPNGNVYARSGKSGKTRTGVSSMLGVVNQVV